MSKATGNRALIVAANKAVRESIAEQRKKLVDIKWVADNVMPLLPAGVSLPRESYNYDRHYVTLSIPADESRPWRGLDGTAMIIARVRKALNVDKFSRSTDGYSADDYTTKFAGHGIVAGESVYVTLRLPGQKPDQCRIVVEEVYDPTPRGLVKKFRTECGPAESAA